MQQIIRFIMIAAVLLSACSTPQKNLSDEEKKAWTHLGDSIAATAQKQLLQKVSAAIAHGGTDYAIAFCEAEALPFTDSIAREGNVLIQRLSDKNRNPANALQTLRDSMAWQKIKTEQTSLVEQDEENGAIYYYKPITIAMPACIQCHGKKEDILESTQKIIAQKYPNDKAIGYQPGDLRGMWKIRWNERK